MKNLLLTISLICLAHLLSAQNGKQFPELVASTITDEEVNIPESTMGKFTLIGLAYSKKSEDDLKTWFQPVYQKFIQEEATGELIPQFKPDINIYFVPMFTGVKQTAAGAAKRKLEKDADPKLHPYVVVYSGKLATYKEELGLDSKDEPYFFVLDKEGKIIFTTRGKFTTKKIDEIYRLVEEWE